MSEEPKLKSVPMVISPIAQYFIGHQLMLREHLTYQQWSSFDWRADVICNSLLKQMPVNHPESEGWDNRRKGDQGAPQ
jgi:hypothetical protein